MEERLFSNSGEWVCPKCGEPASGSKCGRCKFNIYAGFLPRVLSSIVDGLVVWPVAMLFTFLRNHSLTAFWIVTVVGFFFYRLYHIFFVATWGQTPGKMIARIKVVQVNGSPVGWPHALLRNSVETLLAMVLYFLELKTATLVSATDYAAVDFAKRSNLITALVPPFAIYISWISRLYVASEFVVMWMNKKKRAIHDFVGGTVVIHDPRLPLFPWKSKKA
ncbi:MAG TPA: RDD family protein [bacterium]